MAAAERSSWSPGRPPVRLQVYCSRATEALRQPALGCLLSQLLAFAVSRQPRRLADRQASASVRRAVPYAA